jgi:hypothetical protein
MVDWRDVEEPVSKAAREGILAVERRIFFGCCRERGVFETKAELEATKQLRTRTNTSFMVGISDIRN